MTSKIMKANREVLHRQTYCGLKEDDNSNQFHISLSKDFDNSTIVLFGPDISPDDFPGVNLEDTLLYDMYEDYTADAEGCLEDKSEDYEITVVANGLDRQVSTPEVNDNYVNSSVMFPKGDTYARGKVIGRKRDAIRNAVGRRNEKTILDMREYSAEFDDGDVRKMTANMIADYMYAACDDYGNE